jgi:hypothetical protein
MNEHRDTADGAPDAGTTDSHAPAKKPRRKPAIPAVREETQNSLDVVPAMPLHLKVVLNGYAEVEAVGIAAERTMRRYIATGRVKESIIRTGRRLRFVKDLLIEELRKAEE